MAFSCLFPYKLSTVVENSFPLKTSSCSLWVNTYSETNIFAFQSEVHPERRGQQRWPPACSLCQAPEVWISSEVKQLRFNVFFVNSESHYFLLSVPLSSSAEFKWGKKTRKRAQAGTADLPSISIFSSQKSALNFQNWPLRGLQHKRGAPRLFSAPAEREKRTDMAKFKRQIIHAASYVLFEGQVLRLESQNSQGITWGGYVAKSRPSTLSKPWITMRLLSQKLWAPEDYLLILCCFLYVQNLFLLLAPWELWQVRVTFTVTSQVVVRAGDWRDLSR